MHTSDKKQNLTILPKNHFPQKIAFFDSFDRKICAAGNRDPEEVRNKNETKNFLPKTEINQQKIRIKLYSSTTFSVTSGQSYKALYDRNLQL